MILDFKKFFSENNSEEQSDIDKTLSTIPQSHRDFLKGFHISFQGGNTLHGDNQHVGMITTHPRKEIIIAAPWRYSREFTLLHEVGHLVWEYLVSQQLKNDWEEIVQNTKNKQNQPAEEHFCMAYGAAYSKRPPLIHSHPTWIHFIKNLPV